MTDARATEPSLTFLTSVRHPRNSSDYGLAERLLVRTIRSLDSQTDRRCRVVVVANRPVPVPDDVRIPVEQVIVDFPPPSTVAGPRTGVPAVLLDKGTKLAVAASRVHSGHVMFVDSDDFVSRRLTEHAAGDPGAVGWYVERGLMYDWKTGLVRDLTGFNKVCGTSLVIRRDLLPMDVPDRPASQQDLLSQLGEDVVFEQFGSHHHLAARLGLAPLPLVGAVYSVNTGDNHSGKRLAARGRQLSEQEAGEFGIVLRPRALRVGARAVHAARVTLGGPQTWRARLRGGSTARPSAADDSGTAG